MVTMTGDYKKSKWVKGGISIVKDGRVSYNADLTKPRGHRGERKQFRAGSTEAAEAFARKLLDRRDLALGLDIEMDSTWQWLFDEATSALDNVSQSLVTETVAELPITRIVGPIASAPSLPQSASWCSMAAASLSRAPPQRCWMPARSLPAWPPARYWRDRGSRVAEPARSRYCHHHRVGRLHGVRRRGRCLRSSGSGRSAAKSGVC